MKNKTGRYSAYIRPFSYVLDLAIINLLSHLMLSDVVYSLYFAVFISISWVIIALNIGFYEVYRFTKVVSIGNKILKQLLLYTIVCYAFLGLYIKDYNPIETIQYTVLSVFLISCFKLFIYYFLRKYRTLYGGNFRKVVLLGSPKRVAQLAAFFEDNPDYGYQLIQTFSTESDKKAAIESCCNFVKENQIDEIYCSLFDLSNTEVNDIIDFADNNLKILKFLPDNKEFFARNLKLDYYGYIPILSLRNIPLDDIINQMIKRTFDIVFSLFIIVFVLSWLTPILAIFIKSESKGPVFFTQKRNGLNYKEFNCYKFRSMRLNKIADIEQVSKNDPRITRIGRFLRKSSIDELPQFINVFLGEMSVVGPRPHMVSHTEMYARKVDKFMVRHFIKPGITGLAQTNGFRGEVENDKDIIYRVKYDIFYMENWSLLLDIKIIFMTFINAVKGEEKAY
ncbi:exopolysaccharide biosynthesis polyprenyl glycosylphosphotransferase [Flavobacterium sp.]|uniref:exopolysaccharide biosynthesis polyprenyl glycosylphosphotransferase n=1 Tax=Flavobacterium sp. TaxID=239 RepID=UPI00263876FB|nr:exopolysaccharide biosynthesis polyprenyl glycosylphosphotransferase [Flavobacterium sp.]MDD3004346.1 exopolysaccharide biosynthesis polyprenyl glycosylphosphotransferase [Flavobacterium sp.]